MISIRRKIMSRDLVDLRHPYLNSRTTFFPKLIQVQPAMEVEPNLFRLHILVFLTPLQLLAAV